MAIFPVRSNYVIDVDAFTSASYKAGMAIVRDDNGRAIVADSQQLVFKNIYQKSGKFLGFAASDHDVSGNTIIRPDVVGSSYLDSSYGYVQFKDNEFLSPKRALADNLDETASKFYNNIEILSTTRRGIGVYNQPGEIYITDQFSPVLHGDYGFDGLDTQTLNPGDLLTFGGGVNAGKLVKVNLNSFGPDVLVIGQVEKYVSQTGLLHFRLVSYSLSFGSSGLQLYYDTANTASYVPNNSIMTDLVTGTRNATLYNGPIYSSLASGSISLDGTDDYLGTSVNASTVSVTNQISMNFWFMRKDNGIGAGFVLPVNFNQINFGFDYYPSQVRLWHITPGTITQQTTGITTDLNAWVNLTLTYDGSTYILYKNSVNVYSFSITGNITPNKTFAFGITWDIFRPALFSQAQIYNRVLTATEILNSYNFNKSRYGL